MGEAMLEIRYWWRAWKLHGCGNWTVRQIRDALKIYDARKVDAILSPPATEGRNG
jgi:hypothetical protein